MYDEVVNNKPKIPLWLTVVILVVVFVLAAVTYGPLLFWNLLRPSPARALLDVQLHLSGSDDDSNACNCCFDGEDALLVARGRKVWRIPIATGKPELLYTAPSGTACTVRPLGATHFLVELRSESKKPPYYYEVWSTVLIVTRASGKVVCREDLPVGDRYSARTWLRQVPLYCLGTITPGSPLKMWAFGPSGCFERDVDLSSWGSGVKELSVNSGGDTVTVHFASGDYVVFAPQVDEQARTIALTPVSRMQPEPLPKGFSGRVVSASGKWAITTWVPNYKRPESPSRLKVIGLGPSGKRSPAPGLWPYSINPAALISEYFELTDASPGGTWLVLWSTPGTALSDPAYAYLWQAGRPLHRISRLHGNLSCTEWSPEGIRLALLEAFDRLTVYEVTSR